MRRKPQEKLNSPLREPWRVFFFSSLKVIFINRLLVHVETCLTVICLLVIIVILCWKRNIYRPIPLKVCQKAAGSCYVVQNYVKQYDQQEYKQWMQQDFVRSLISIVSPLSPLFSCPQQELLFQSQAKTGKKILLNYFKASSKTFTTLSKEGSLK